LLSGIYTEGELQKRVFGNGPAGEGFGVGSGDLKTSGRLNLFPDPLICVSPGRSSVSDWAATVLNAEV
jgi:hypothetical protein